MRCPCGQKCPNRDIRCRETCEEFKKYYAERQERYKQNEDKYLVESYVVSATLRNAKRRTHGKNK